MRSGHHSLFVGLLMLTAGANAVQVQASAEVATASQTVSINGLEWTQASNGDNIKWPKAVEFCDQLSLSGHADWRLPTLDELAALHDGDASEGIREPFSIGDCCLWSGESLVDRPAEDGDEIAGGPEMYHWGFMYDGGFPYYAVHIFDDGRALCTRDLESSSATYQ